MAAGLCDHKIQNQAEICNGLRVVGLDALAKNRSESSINDATDRDKIQSLEMLSPPQTDRQNHSIGGKVTKPELDKTF